MLSERLDRALTNDAWLLRFPFTKVKHLPRLYSDHRPILICCEDINRVRVPRPFKFLAPWLKHENFHNFLQDSWKAEVGLPAKLLHLSSVLRQWNKSVFGDVFKRKRELLVNLEQLERQNSISPLMDQLAEEKRVRSELESTLAMEEIIWIQKARCKNMLDGDRNTSYYHKIAPRRRAFNRITRLKDSEGNWVEDDKRLMKLAVDFFALLFTEEGINATDSPPTNVAKITEIQKSTINLPFRRKGILNAVKEMGSLKAPGKDLFHPIFFQKCWDTVGKDLVEFVQRVFVFPEAIRTVNDTIIALIPKVGNPTTISQFRPISLCNVAYKTVAKCIAHRMKGLMPNLVHPTQTSFVPGRHIIDNIIVVQEVVHTMHAKRSGKGMMVLKNDLAKAYDKVRWDFVVDTLRAMNFPEKMINIIFHCMSTTSCQVQWNGGLSESFTPSRGLRQGCPLSPYLFTLCMERLSNLICESVSMGDWEPISLTRGGTKLTHMFFADDLMHFGYACERQAIIINEILKKFSAILGQEVSREKSRVYFSA
ncbi:Transposon TX1 uncharacterized 149 kDa protein [Linum perenne]